VRELADFPLPERGAKADRFLAAHQRFIARARSGGVDVLFVGDSITEGWNDQTELWAATFAPLGAANFGIGGDQTQHVLWRLQNGELDGLSPRVVVLLIGTNNTWQHTALEIAGATRRILRTIFDHAPESRVLLHAVFPRGARQNSNGTVDDGVERSAVIRELNPMLAALAAEPAFSDRVSFVDLTARLSTPEGAPNPDLFRDNLHLTPAGYQVWADALHPLLAHLP
jgi:beta-glucosidase